MKHAAIALRLGAVALALLASPTARLSAATVVWQGGAGGDLWGNPGNWFGGVAPRDGDDVVFGASPSFQSLLDYSLSLGSLTFAATATPTDIHVGAGGSSILTLSGAGIVNNTPFVSGAGLQNVFADASSGPVGATLLFANTASVGGSIATTLVASGAAVAGGGGGTIVFQDHSSTAIDRNFNGLIAAGATVAGASGGTVILRGDARAQDTTQIVARAGNGSAAAGGQITVQDRARIESNVSVLQGESGGYGGRLDFRDSAVFSGGLLQNFGASSALAGGEAVTRFFDNTTFGGAAENYAGGGAGFAGGRMEFHGHAAFDGGLDGAQIINQGSTVDGAAGGRTVFYDDSFAAQVGIFNEANADSNAPGTAGGTSEFRDRSRAGQASIVNDGANASVAGTLAGRTLFFDSSSAESASITNLPGYTAGAPGGATIFAGHSTAGNATISVYGVGAGLDGQVLFQDSASGGTAQIVTNAGGLFDISALTTSGTTIGSAEGGGRFLLGSKTLTIGANGLSTEVSGVFSDGGQAGGAGGALTKVGTGTLTLSGTNTYTGATSVAAGTLRIDGSILGSGVSVASGATLGGTGTIAAPVLVGAGATLAPGGATAPGALTVVGSLVLDPAAMLHYRLGAPGVVGGPFNDLLTVSGNLTLAGTLDVANSGGFGLGSYRLIDYGGTLTDDGLALGALPGGFTAGNVTVQTSVGGQVNLVVGGAAVLFWDGAHLTPNGVVDGGSGSWNNASSNWTNAGGTVNVGWGSTFAVFTGAPGTVTVTAPVSTTGMQFATSAYTVSADPGASIALVGNATIRVNPGVSATIDAPLVGSGALVRVDTGTLTLAGNNSYSGGTTIQDGLTIVTNAAGMGLGTGPVTVLATPTSELEFAGNASAGSVPITNVGAPSTLVSAFVQFRDNASAGSATITNQGNTGSGGLGGQVNFVGTSSAGNASIANLGSAFAPPAGVFANNGAGITLFAGNATGGNAAFVNGGSLAPGAEGGRVFFSGASSAGSSTISNLGAAVVGSNGGLTQFYGGTTAGNATLTNAAATATGVSYGGLTAFVGNSDAGSAVFRNAGGATINAFYGSAGGVTFSDTSSAGGATIGNGAGTASGARAGYAVFSVNGTAGNATISNTGAAVSGAFGGYTEFFQASNAGSASIAALGGTATGAGGGVTYFSDFASAASATLDTFAATVAGAEYGSLQLNGLSTAANATITNHAATVVGADGGETRFSNSASASASVIHNLGSSVAGAGGGAATFTDTSSASAGRIFADAGTGGGAGGSIVFLGNSSGTFARFFLAGTGAGAGSLDVSSVATAGFGIGSLEGSGGIVSLGNHAVTVGSNSFSTTYAGTIADGGLAGGVGGSLIKAGTGTLTLSGASSYTGGTLIADGAIFVTSASGLALGTGPVTQLPTTTSELRFLGGGSAGAITITNTGAATTAAYAGTTFHDNATAATATLVNRGNIANGGYGGLTFFNDTSTAGSAFITNAGTSFLGPVASSGAGVTAFFDAASAGHATILNASSLNGSTIGGRTVFDGTSSAGTSTITNQGGQAAGRLGGETTFGASSSAGSSTIFTNGGAVSGAAGAFTYFVGASTAANATLYAGAAPPGGVGGSVVFVDTSSGGAARAIVQGGAGLSPGGLDISQLSASGMTIGSIEGGGIVSLGSKLLTVGGNDASTVFSGLIRDGGFVNGSGGRLDVQGAGSLKLTGANTYTGATHIGDGVDAHSGKLIVANGVGSATGSGPVFVDFGGTLSGTGHVAGPVTLHAGGLIAPGDPATLTFEGNVTWDGGGVFQLVLGDNQADSDLVSILGSLIRGTDGEFRFNLIDAGFVPGQQYELIQAGALVGFSASDFTVSGIDGHFEFVDGALDFSAVATPVPEPETLWLMLAGGALLVGARRRLRAVASPAGKLGRVA